MAPSTSTRHPREARPSNWAQRGGPASGGKLSPDAEATFHRASCTLGNQVVDASDGPPFRQESRPTRLCRTPRAGSGLLAEAGTTASWVIVSLSGDRIVEHRRVQRARRPHHSLPHRANPATVYQARPKAHPGTRTDSGLGATASRSTTLSRWDFCLAPRGWSSRLRMVTRRRAYEMSSRCSPSTSPGRKPPSR